MPKKLSFDPKKRAKALAERGLDFKDVVDVFEGVHFTLEDTRKDYGERRYISVGYLKSRMVVTVWTPRNGKRHVISLRKANRREQKIYKEIIQENLA